MESDSFSAELSRAAKSCLDVSFSDLRGKVTEVDSYFTHARAPVAAGLFLFNHRAENAAPEALRKVGTEVIIYRDEDMLLKIRAAPPRIPARKAAAPQVSPAQESRESDGKGSATPAALLAAPSKKIPPRRRG